jgi:hypothetical protein
MPLPLTRAGFLTGRGIGLARVLDALDAGRHRDIGRLDIAVDDPASVCVRQGRRHLPSDVRHRSVGCPMPRFDRR